MGLYRPLGRLIARNSGARLPREHDLPWRPSSRYASSIKQRAPATDPNHGRSDNNMSSLSRSLRHISRKEPYFEFRSQQLRNTETSTALSCCGSSGVAKLRAATRYSCVPFCVPCLERPCGPSRSKMNRHYSSQSGPRAPLAEIQNSDCVDNAVQSSTTTKRTIPWKQHLTKSSVSQNTALKIGVDSQQASSTSWPIKTPVSKYWSHRLYKRQDGKDIVVHYCRSLDITEKVAQLFLNETVLGFDMEWQASATTYDSIQENVSLIQLASRDRIALFHIALFRTKSGLEDLVSPTLKRVLENPDIIKAGVAIKGDCTRLRKYLGINARGSFELSHLYKLIKYCHNYPSLINKFRVKLTEQTEEHLGLPLAKDVDTRCSDWQSPMSCRQAHYAAADAYAGYQLFQTMDAKRKALSPVPPLPACDELNLPIRITPEASPDSDLANNIEPVKRASVSRRRSRTVDSVAKPDPKPANKAVASLGRSRTI
ncbi:ribonuclease H-like domain-containing protein [Aspergillus aurantiobrunneus]